MKKESFIKRNIGKLKSHFAKKKEQNLKQQVQQLSDIELTKQIRELSAELRHLKISLSRFYRTVSNISPLRMMDYTAGMEGFGRNPDALQPSDYDISRQIQNCEQYLSALTLERERRQKESTSSMQ